MFSKNVICDKHSERQYAISLYDVATRTECPRACAMRVEPRVYTTRVWNRLRW
jgi:hypothetical protein